MTELIFEVGCEDLPARFVQPALEQLKAHVQDALAKQRIAYGPLRALGTPRRLALLIEDVAPRQGDLHEERLGPPVSAAMREGVYTKAAEGFARGQGVSLESLYTVQTPRGEYIATKVFAAGEPTAQLLPSILEQALAAIHLPKSMRWGAGTTSFARPIRWMVARLGELPLTVRYAGVTSGVHTVGHRFSSPSPIEVTSAAQYVESLRQAGVLVDPQARRDMIMALLAQIERESGGQVIPDEGLLEEVIQLVEHPYAVCVRFDASYLELPPEVLILSMRSHQRYFALRDPVSGALLNACAVIYNTPVRDPDVVRAGNLRVLKARLDDARFFWHQDLKQPLEARLDALDSVVWLGELGSVRDRAQRISMIAQRLALALGLSPEHVQAAERAGLLCKADLVTQMVFEFTDLQGVMGRAYAARSGEPEAVSLAIAEHYLPRGAEDDLPQTEVGAVVALAERLDTLVGTFGLNLIPKSSADPYGLRRAALGVLRILSGRAWTLRLDALLTLSVQVYQAQGKALAFKLPEPELRAALSEFIITRYKHLLQAQRPTDVVDAVLAVASDEIVGARERVEALSALRGEPDFEPLAIGFKRVVNILRKQADAREVIPQAVDASLLRDAAELALSQATTRAAAALEVSLAAGDWPSACATLIALKQPIDDFFDQVMVMDQDDALRRNRLALLDQLRALFLRVADISMIQTERA